VIHYGLRGPAAVLDERAQLQLRQALILKFARAGAGHLSAGPGVRGCFRDPRGRSVRRRVPDRWYRGAAHLDRDSGRRDGTDQQRDTTWQLDAPPADWQAQIEHAERFHIAGTWTAIIAFAAFLADVIANGS
jgi:hypothetical protein